METTLTLLLQMTVLMVPALIAIVAYLDKKSAKRQLVLQEAVFLILGGLECIGQLSRCNACDMQKEIGDNISTNTARALVEYDKFFDELNDFKKKVTSKNV